MRPRKKGCRLSFLVTAGGTREYIDPVRFISNASSGKMGYGLADAAAAAGHDVTLITAPVNLPSPKGVKIVEVESANDMFEAVKGRFDRCDALIMAAAVSDYTPVRQAQLKIRKGKKEITLKLRPTVDILKWTGSHKRKGQIVVGFALEDKNLRANARMKLIEKNLDMIIANKLSAIGADSTSVWIKTGSRNWLLIKKRMKTAIARKIIRLSEKIYCSK
ncbi:MAG: phosphopantothenoylcysteine decarboxylase [Sedimentisphaerales bacterium]|nr:phosphopantothenoylcysteine decarboxylase [Sedimentisphaerales bacterium]